MTLNLQQLKEFSHINNLSRIGTVRLITCEDVSSTFVTLLWTSRVSFTEEMDKKFQLLRKNKKYFQTMIEKLECIKELELLIKKCDYEGITTAREILLYGMKYKRGKIDITATRNIYRAKELLKILHKKYLSSIYSIKLKTFVTKGEIILVEEPEDCCERNEGVYIKYKDIDYIFFISPYRYALFKHLFTSDNKLKVYAITRENRAIISTIEVLK